jgi:hypothetical protein
MPCCFAVLRMKDSDRFSLAAMRRTDAPAPASAFNVSRSAGVQGASFAILLFIRHKIGDHAWALPNLDVVAIDQAFGDCYRSQIVRQDVAGSWPINVAVFSNGIETVFGHADSLDENSGHHMMPGRELISQGTIDGVPLPLF